MSYIPQSPFVSLTLSCMWNSHTHKIQFDFLLSICFLLSWLFSHPKEPEERKGNFFLLPQSEYVHPRRLIQFNLWMRFLKYVAMTSVVMPRGAGEINFPSPVVWEHQTRHSQFFSDVLTESKKEALTQVMSSQSSDLYSLTKSISRVKGYYLTQIVALPVPLPEPDER